MQQTIQVVVLDEHMELYNELNKNYGNSHFALDLKKRNLIKKSERVCRFCDRGCPDTSFTKKAHLIPRYLGNLHMLSDFECDECNLRFGTSYEEDFGRFLGVSRFIHDIRNNGKHKIFESSGDKIRVEKGCFNDLNGIKISTIKDKSYFDYDEEKDIIKIDYYKHKYRPVFVFKSFLKIALSVLDADVVVRDYKNALGFLKTEVFNGRVKGCMLYSYVLPLTYCFKPHALLFIKKDKEYIGPTHIFQFYFLNFIFEFPIPFNQSDSSLSGKPNVLHRRCPAILPSNLNFDNLEIEEYSYNLASEEYRSELENLSVTMQLDNQDRDIIKNTNTGISSEFDDRKISTVFIATNS